MDKITECRRQEMRCRQLAMYDTGQAWKWLAEAEMWEHKTHSLLKEKISIGSTDLANSKAA